ncbi:MAG TPA: B-box zinc finger protein [Candidatus Acidoferrales bacterium]|nr:B-box zinc finger protein [Candidatus Acidoferrales bacterium]
MKCAVHPEVDAVGFCRNCGKALCSQCAREVRGALYCETCLAAMMAPQGPAAQFAPTAPAPGYAYAAVEPQGPNPATAAVLGFVPGLGAVYNGEYVKGLIHVLIFGGVIAILNSDSTPSGMQALLGVFLAVFICYMPIEAYRVAKAKRYGLPYTGFFGETATAPAGVGASPPGVAPAPGGEYVAEPHRPNLTGAIVLIVLGVIFLFGTMGVVWVWNLWPLALVAIGVALILRRTRRAP